MKALIVKNIHREFSGRTIVNDVSLLVNAGEIVGLLGPNGAGKTTCFYMMVGLVKAQKGTIFLGDQDITHAPMHVRARYGLSYLPQEESVFRKLTVADNIAAILEHVPGLSKKQQAAMLETLLEEFSITQIRDSMGMSLSGGERRRVEIARALAIKPEFILLDEPFAGVDPISVQDIQGIITLLCQKGIGVLITDHNVRETLKICHRAYIMNAGMIIAEGTPEQVLANDQVRDVYLGNKFQL